MNDLRLADDVGKAAEYISVHKDTDVEVQFLNGSRTIYVKGRDISPVWLASAMPEVDPGHPASYLDMTPSGIRFGRWLVEDERFVASRSLSVEEFLAVYRLSSRKG